MSYRPLPPPPKDIFYADLVQSKEYKEFNDKLDEHFDKPPSSQSIKLRFRLNYFIFGKVSSIKYAMHMIYLDKSMLAHKSRSKVFEFKTALELKKFLVFKLKGIEQGESGLSF